MSGALDESARPVRDRVVWCVRERAERIVGDVDAGRVDVVLRARRPVLEVIPSRVLGHPGAFDERPGRRVAMVLAEPLPPVLLGLETEQPFRRSPVGELLGLVELDDMQRISVRGVPIEEPAVRVRIVKERGVPGTGLHRVRLGEHVGLACARQRQRGEQPIVEFHASGRRLGEHQDRQRRGRRRQEIDGVPHGQRGRCHDVGQRPARGRDVAPGAEVVGLPVAVADRLEEIIVAAVHHYDGIGAGAVGDGLVLLLEIVAVVDVDRVGIRAPTGRRGLCRATRGGDDGQHPSSVSRHGRHGSLPYGSRGSCGRLSRRRKARVLSLRKRLIWSMMRPTG